MIHDLVVEGELARGKHGVVFKGTYQEKKCAIKTLHPETTATFSVGKESYYLKKLNEYNIGPKLLYSDDEHVVMELLLGKRIDEFNLLERSDIVEEILRQCRVLDKLGISKQEMIRPYKHILVEEEPFRAVMIDFERSIRNNKPKNVTQFSDYLRRRGFKVDRDLLIKYKETMSDEDYNILVNSFIEQCS